MHQSYDYNNRLISNEVVRAENQVMLNEKLISLHQRDINNPNVTRIVQRKIGRNEICPCGSGKKFKKCCLIK